MLKYKINTENSEYPIILDKRLSYNDNSILHILEYIFKQYNTKNYTIRKLYKRKLNDLTNLNFNLVTKKATYKNLLNKVDYNPYMIEQLYIILKNSTPQKFKNMSEVYHYLTHAIDNINNDIKLINQLKKSFKGYIKEYLKIDTCYSDTAKITLYDVQQAEKKVLTRNSKECLYFYLMQFKKTNSKELIINNSLNPLLEYDVLKETLNKCIKESYENHILKTIKNTILTTTNNLLDKWL